MLGSFTMESPFKLTVLVTGQICKITLKAKSVRSRATILSPMMRWLLMLLIFYYTGKYSFGSYETSEDNKNLTNCHIVS